MARRKLTAEERRERIMTAARQSFTSKGFAGATTRAIAKAAGITEAVLYQHFSSKQDIFEQAMLEPVNRDNQVLMGKLDALAGTADSTLADTIHAEGELLTEIGRLLPAIGALFYADPQPGRANYTELTAPAFARQVDQMARTEASKKSISAFLTMAYGINLGIALHHHFTGDDLNTDDVSVQVARLLRTGIDGSPNSKGDADHH
ncbi:TetR/AcrR family transcriptional regulator [Mycolicibacterium sphagni]|uniref:TetR/AcrR family transcriptional regulator n=1 Tax=Mycolicibacterium sphagni TaxID=1786 RepID=UPI0013FE45D3|nr:TetR/AcrR family transcriptional regulator [Mycolicibacterium sphagni]